MGLQERVSHLMTADLSRLLARSRRPEVVIDRVIRDMEEAIVELRREAVIAVCRQKRLEKQLSAAQEEASAVEREASMALQRGDELRARQILGAGIYTMVSRDTLSREAVGAGQLTTRLLVEMVRLEKKGQALRALRRHS